MSTQNSSEIQFRWDDLDHRLLTIRLEQLSAEMQERIRGEERKVQHRAAQTNNGAALFPLLSDMHAKLTEEWIRKSYEIHRRVWETQGGTINGRFIRAVRDHALIPLIDVRVSSIEAEMELLDQRTGGIYPNAKAVIAEWQRRGKQISTSWAKELEATAIEQEYAGSEQASDSTHPASEIRFDQRQNFREAIIKAKARIAQIERTLSRPIPVSRSGQPFKVSQVSLLRLEEEKLGLALKVDELERELIRLDRRDESQRESGNPSVWRNIHTEFRALLDEEVKHAPGNATDKWLIAQVSYSEPNSSSYGDWLVYRGLNEEFKARFEALATRAGLELDPSRPTRPLHVWLHYLFQDLLDHGSEFLFAAERGVGGMILRLCAASATFSARLEIKALEKHNEDFQTLHPSPSHEKSKPDNMGKQSHERTRKAATRKSRTKSPPVAFISYSYDDSEHKEWVLELASRLQDDGVKIILDRWDLSPGQDKAVFMESSVAESDFVILICTPKYADRANRRDGGVGYEAMIITSEIADDINDKKFIPVLRKGDFGSSLPRWIKNRLGVDLSANPYSKDEYENLLRALHQEPVNRPPIGSKPQFGSSANVQRARLPLRVYNFDGTAGPILVSGKQRSVHGPFMDLWCRVTIVNCTHFPMKIGPIRVVIDGLEWPLTNFFFRLKSDPRERFQRISLMGNEKEHYELHFMFPEENCPQNRCGHLLVESEESSDPVRIDVKFA